MNKTALLAAGLLITASAMAALVAEKMEITKTCNDVRVAMDGAIDATVEKGGLTSPKWVVTLFKHHNYKKYKLDSIEVNPAIGAGDTQAFVGQNLKLTVSNKINKSGRQPASLMGEVGGEKVSVNLGCTK
jgi:hypothetical protein